MPAVFDRAGAEIERAQLFSMDLPRLEFTDAGDRLVDLHPVQTVVT